MDKIEKIKLGKSRKIGSITLTCRKFLTGVTIKPWDSILILNDIESAESYFQAIFRVQSSWVDYQTKEVLKPKGWVFDFAISRCLRTTYTYADALTDQVDQQDSHTDHSCQRQPKRITDSLCKTLDIKTFYEGSLTSDPVTSREISRRWPARGPKLH